MENKYNAAKKIKIPAYEVGDAVTVKVPTLDRGPLDLKRVPGVIVKITNGFHKIRTQFGVLKTQYRTDELERCSFMVAEVDGWTDDAVLTLREVARKFNMRTNEVAVCKCKSTCATKKCQCFKNGIRCTTCCHSGLGCSNKGTYKIAFIFTITDLLINNMQLQTKNLAKKMKDVVTMMKNAVTMTVDAVPMMKFN